MRTESTLRWLRRSAISAASLGLVFTGLSVPADAAQSTAAESARAAAVRNLKQRLPDAVPTRTADLGNGITRTRYIFKATEIRKQRASWKANAREKQRIARHVEQRMRQGINLHSDSVDVVPFEVPDKVVFHLVQHKSDQVSDFIVDITEVKTGEHFYMDFMSSFANVDDAAEVGSAAGFDSGTGSNATRQGRGVRTIFFVPDYHSDKDHWVTQNWEKWRSSSNYRDWAYNSYATFDAADGTYLWRGELVDATIRARPYAGYKSRVTGGPYDYEPHPKEVCHAVTTGAINIGQFASLSVPYMNCYSGQEIYPNGRDHSMGTAFYGDTIAQVYIDFAADFEVASSSTIPIFSDYIWMSVEYCHARPFCINGYYEHNKWTDGGWSS